MKTTNKDLFKALDFFKNITVANIFELSKTTSNNEEKFEAEVFHARVSVFYHEDDDCFHCSIKPFNRGFDFCFFVRDNKIIEAYFRMNLNIQSEIQNNDEELSDISIQVYSFVKEQNKHFEKEIVKEKIDNF
tara:strand:+ start:13959 stop:14354 length:396 start_codon:yes stop_codon:yes gene_type:complete